MLKTLVTVPASRSMQMLHLGGGVKNRSVGRFCETPIDVSQAGV
jgi:hypothetical protein